MRYWLLVLLYRYHDMISWHDIVCVSAQNESADLFFLSGGQQTCSRPFICAGLFAIGTPVYKENTAKKDSKKDSKSKTKEQVLINID